MKTTNYLPLLLALFVGFSNCKRDDDCPCIDPTNPECPNYDPCYGVEPPSAGFTLQESYLGHKGWRWTLDDSIFFGSNIKFSSPYEGDDFKHTWYLGSEVIHDAEFTREHPIPVNQRPYTITVSHVLEYPIDSACYSAATGRDSVSRTYTLIRSWSDFLSMHNTLRCAFEGQTDSFDLFFGIFDANGDPADIGSTVNDRVVVNFHNSGDSITRWISFGSRNSIIDLRGDGHNQYSPRGEIVIDRHTLKLKMEYRYLQEDYFLRGRVVR